MLVRWLGSNLRLELLRPGRVRKRWCAQPVFTMSYCFQIEILVPFLAYRVFLLGEHLPFLLQC